VTDSGHPKAQKHLSRYSVNLLARSTPTSQRFFLSFGKQPLAAENRVIGIGHPQNDDGTGGASKTLRAFGSTLRQNSSALLLS
jgi:hypothetical protein